MLVERRLSAEVEGIERLEVREPRRLEATIGRTLLTLQQLQLAQLQEEPQVINVVLGGAPRDLLALPVHRGELERLQVVLQEDQAFGFEFLHGFRLPGARIGRLPDWAAEDGLP